MNNKIKVKFYYLFRLIQDDILTFFSGIFVSIALNILTSNLPESILTLGTTQLLLTILMLIASFVFIRWAIVIRPILASFSEQEIAIEQLGEPTSWYNLLTLAQYEKDKKRLVFYFLFEVSLTAICFLLLIYPNCFSEIGKWISFHIPQGDVLPKNAFLPSLALSYLVVWR